MLELNAHSFGLHTWINSSTSDASPTSQEYIWKARSESEMQDMGCCHSCCHHMWVYYSGSMF